MGILDDAIREHLELKRAHGAADDEVLQKEAEAFGPARQEAAAPEAVAPPLEQAPVAEAPEAEAPLEHPADPDDFFVEHENFGAAATEPVADPGMRGVDPHPTPVPHPAFDQHDDPRSHEHPPEPVFHHAAAPAAPPEAPVEDPPVVDPPIEDPPIEEPPVEEPPIRAEPAPIPADPAPVAEEPPAPVDGEDVLEDTPEFLQDAPEHDRLWFEQKPPRDFDFGE
jgi:hypothetical protein